MVKISILRRPCGYPGVRVKKRRRNKSYGVIYTSEKNKLRVSGPVSGIKIYTAGLIPGG